MQDSGHFCPYPRTYPARIGHRPKATSGHWKSCRATKDAWFSKVLEVPLGGLADARAEAGSETPSPRDSGLKSPPMHERSLRFSLTSRADTIARDFVRLFRCSIPG
jgi:hypothetical protein